MKSSAQKDTDGEYDVLWSPSRGYEVEHRNAHPSLRARTDLAAMGRSFYEQVFQDRRQIKGRDLGYSEACVLARTLGGRC